MKFNTNIELSKKDNEKGLVLPTEMSEQLAEVVGIQFGDGSLQNRYNCTYKIGYTLNLRDSEYADYVQLLLFNCFHVNFTRKIDSKRNCISLYLCSKTLCKFINEQLLVPYSPKRNLTIPGYLYENKDYLCSFIRGLFDTDGCFTVQRSGKYSYNQIKITTGLEPFAKQIKLALCNLGMASYICRKKEGFDVTIRRKESYSLFMNLIKPKKRWGCWDLNPDPLVTSSRAIS
jgi:intein-encoded DNA endonuclease-like protein